MRKHGPCAEGNHHFTRADILMYYIAYLLNTSHLQQMQSIALVGDTARMSSLSRVPVVQVVDRAHSRLSRDQCLPPLTVLHPRRLEEC